MPILVTCNCGKKFRADEKHSGKQTTCPKCSQALSITGPIVSAYDVFVSYSSNDKATCDALCATFERKGLRCWIAPRDILPGMNWGEAIINGIEQCRVMVLVFSAHSNESPQVKREVERAVSKGLPVVPLRIEDVKLSRAMEYFISSQHWLDALTPPLENHLMELARKVSKLLADDSPASASEPIVPEALPMARPIFTSSAPTTELPTATFNPTASAEPWPGVQSSDSRWSDIASPSLASAAPTFPHSRAFRRKSWWANLPIHWRWTAFSGGAVALFCLLLFLLQIPRASGTIKLDISGLTSNVTVKIDDDAITASQLSQPLRLKTGEHRIEVTGRDIEPASKSFTVDKGENRQIELALVSKPRVPESRAITSKPSTQPVPTEIVVKQPTVGTETAVSKSASPEPTNPKSIVPSDATPFQGHSYKYFGESLSWKEAKQRCESMGGHLPIVETAPENEFIEQLAEQGFPQGIRQSNESVWLGATDEATEGEWLWIDGSRVTYTNWLDNQPGNFKGQEHYVQLCLYRNPNRASGGWADLPNISKEMMVHFICEWDSIGIAPAAEDILNNAGARTDAAWTDLFNGRDLAGWVRISDGRPVTSGWKVEEGAIHIVPSGGGDIRSAANFGDFELEFEWKISKGGNSGVLYRVGNQPATGKQLEYQVLDDDVHVNGKDAITSAGSIFAVDGGRSKAVRPVGQWNTAKIIARGNHLEHWLNGSKVAEADIGSEFWNRTVTQRPFAKEPQFGKSTGGHIVLQDHGNEAWFRNIHIRKLTADISAIPADPVVVKPLSPAERAWTDMFNGKDLTGWTPFASEGGWSVKNGILSTTPGEGSLLTDRDFSDFELELEYRISKGANSGVFIRAPSSFEPSGSGLLEIQLQDDGAFPPAAVVPLTRTGSVFRIIPAAKIVKAPPEAWNKLSIHADGPQITVIVNGQTTVDASLNDYAQLTKDKPNATHPAGRIGLQRRLGSSVEFRKIRIRELN